MGESLPFEYVRWTLAERFGWTLEQVDALSLADLHEFYQVVEGTNKAKGIGVKVHGKEDK